MEALIKKVYGNVYDVFWDEGWLHWTRVVYKRGEVKYIKGRSVQQKELDFLKTVLDEVTVGPANDDYFQAKEKQDGIEVVMEPVA